VPRARLPLLSLALAVSLLVAACGGSESTGTGADSGQAEGGTEGQAAQGGMLIDLQNLAFGDPSHIDPGLADTLQGAQIPVLLYDGLTEFDFTDPSNPELMPQVAESFESNDDATVWTFQLRDDVTFSNGDPVLPSSFAYAWNRVVDPEFASEVAYHFGPILGAAEVAEGTATELEGVVADDEAMTLTVTLAYPFADFAAVVSHPVFSPLPEEEVSALADQTQWEQGIMIGNGPFVMTEPWQHDVSITLARNEDYYGGLTGEQAILDGVEFRISADVDSAYADFEAGNGQTGLIPSGRFAEATSTYPNATENNLGVYHFFINQESQLGGDENLKLRQAISLGLDREAINDTVYDGARRLPTGLTPPGVPGYEDGLCGDMCTYDPERAQELVDEWRAEGGSLDHPIVINFNSGSGHEEVVTLMQANLQAIGLEAELDGRDPTTYFSEMRQGACELCRAGWIWDYPVYDSAIYSLLHSSSIDGDNLARFNDPEVDAAIDEARTVTDDEERFALYREAEQRAIEEVAIVPVNWYTGQIVYDESVENFVQTPLQFVLYEQVGLSE
jgi:oligopeptide transport system substrate-binding protein